STTLSVSSCRTSRARSAPSARRTATSLRRPVPRATYSPAALARAINTTSPTAPNSTSTADRPWATASTFSAPTTHAGRAGAGAQAARRGGRGGRRRRWRVGAGGVGGDGRRGRRGQPGRLGVRGRRRVAGARARPPPGGLLRGPRRHRGGDGPRGSSPDLG